MVPVNADAQGSFSAKVTSEQRPKGRAGSGASRHLWEAYPRQRAQPTVLGSQKEIKETAPPGAERRVGVSYAP